MKPTIGRIVHVVLADGQHRAALVVNAWPDSTSCNVKVELDAANDLVVPTERHGYTGPALRPSVRGGLLGGIYLGGAELHLSSIKQDEDGQAPGTWHWPERE